MKYVMILLAMFLGLALARTGSAQPAPAKPNQPERNAQRQGAITGRVIGPDGQPMAGAWVHAYRISEKNRSEHTAESDDDGNFKLAGLAPGAYLLAAYAPGYVTPEALSESQVYRIGDHVTISMVKGGVLTGRVTDEVGEPLVGVTVSAHRLRGLDGKPADWRSEPSGPDSGATDDRGIYRLYGLRPGVYLVSIGQGAEYSFNDLQLKRDAPTYYPAATRDTAGEIVLRSGEEVSGIDIRHRAERGHTVSGSISAAAGESESSSYNHAGITLRGFDHGRFEGWTAASATRGFAIYGVPDGEYELIATHENDTAETSASGRRRLSVRGTDVSGIELKLAPHGSIAGRIKLAASNPPKSCASNVAAAAAPIPGQVQAPTLRQPGVEEIIIKAERDDPNPRAPASGFFRFERYGRPPNEQGEFALKQLEAGRYRLTANLPDDGWRISAILQPGPAGPARPAGQPGQSARSGQAATGATRPPAGAAKNPADAARHGIALKPGEKLSNVEVLIAGDGATLSGRVTPATDGMKLPTLLRVHLIPTEATAADDVMRYAEAEVRGDGSFVASHLAPGKYLLLARPVAEKDAGADESRPLAWDALERAKLRREAAAAQNEIELQPCARVKEHVLRFK